MSNDCALADRSTIGIDLVAGSDLSLRATARPSIRGIITSRRMTSGWAIPTCAKPSTPSLAAPTSEPSIHKLLSGHLQMEGYQAATASDRGQGLGQVGVAQPAGPLLAVELPPTDGLAGAR